MNRSAVMRGALRVGGVFNLGAASLLAFPQSLGRLAGLPDPGSIFYAWMLAALVGLFGCVYLWMAGRPQIDRSLTTVAALGKCAVFFVSLVCWLQGEIAGPAMIPAVGDLIFGLIFAWWLVGESRDN